MITYRFKKYNGAVVIGEDDCSFKEDDLNEIILFFETLGNDDIISVEIDGKQVSLAEAEHIIFGYEQDILLKEETITKEEYDVNMKYENLRYNKTKENFDVFYWLATYKEVGGEEFGALNGLVYEEQGDAINAIKNDIEEYKLGLNGKIEVNEDDEHNRWSIMENGRFVCVWELQAVRMSKEFNQIDD